MLRFSLIFLMLYSALGAAEKALSTIAFGSCANQYSEQPVWGAIAKHKPELMIMLGDNIYADVDDALIKAAMDTNVTEPLEAKVRAHFETQYAAFAAIDGFAALRKTTPFIVTWDDHDFGKNDMGKDFPFKTLTKELFFDFWNEPKDSPRRAQPEGVYAGYVYGPKGKRVQVILLDSRYMRDAQYTVGKPNMAFRERTDMGPYLADPNPDARMLGDAQWRWLEAELAKPAELRIIGCSIQFLPEFTGWESWANFPKERERLMKLIEKQRAEHVVFISGDTHWSEFSRVEENTPYPFWELTSSGINSEWPQVSPNVHRVGEPFYRSNFGLILIDWETNPSVTMQIRDKNDTLIMEQRIGLETLTFKP